MVPAELFGILAAIIILSSFIPQISRAYKTKSLIDVSYFFMLFLTVGLALWAVYGFMRNDLVIIGSNVIGVSLNCVLLLMKKHYGKRAKREGVKVSGFKSATANS